MDGLGRLAISILATLNEAGEDYGSALLNTCIRCTGASGEPERIINAILGLMDQSFVEIAVPREKGTGALLPLSPVEAKQTVGRLRSSVDWDCTSRLWRWSSGEPRFYVLTTEEGHRKGTELLRAFGAGIADPQPGDDDGSRG